MDNGMSLQIGMSNLRTWLVFRQGGIGEPGGNLRLRWDAPRADNFFVDHQSGCGEYLKLHNFSIIADFGDFRLHVQLVDRLTGYFLHLIAIWAATPAIKGLESRICFGRQAVVRPYS